MKRRIALLLVFAVSAVIVLAGVTGNGQAFTSGSISLNGSQWTASFIPSNDDTGGNNLDYFCVVCYNADGTLNDIDIRNKPTSDVMTNAVGPCDSTWGPAVLPLSAVLKDPSTPPTGISEESSAAAPYCGVAWNPPGQEPTNNDADGDGVADANDNCPAVANPDQADSDGDGIGNACDPDDDNDGVNDGQDQCADTPAGTSVGPDGCPLVVGPDDADGDGIADANDNCPAVANPDQADSDGDGIGNACDPDSTADEDADGVIDALDQCPGTPAGTQVNRVGCTRRAPGGGNDPGGNGGGNTAAPIPGCDVIVAVPDWAVGGTLLKTTEAYFGPDITMTTGIVLDVGKTTKVIGMDATGGFYEIMWNCSYLWVPVGTIGPTFDNVWNGAPLPTNAVQ